MRAPVNIAIARWIAVAAASSIAIGPTVVWAASGDTSLVRLPETRWLPSLAVTSGLTLQQQSGSATLLLFDGDSADPSVPVLYRPPTDGSDLNVSPFVGAVLEVMAPALPVVGRPRLFVNGEILPTFASDRSVAKTGEPERIRGPGVGDPIAADEEEIGFIRQIGFGEDEANGQGMETLTKVGKLVYGASAGVAFPFEFRGRSMRIRTSVGWIRYEVEADGLVVHPDCAPDNRCTDVTRGPFVQLGFLREVILSGSESKTFDGFGPGLDVEMDTGRFGPLTSALFLGARAYYVPGNREISFGASTDIVDPIGTDTVTAQWSTQVDPWMFRGALGFRLYWTGPAR